jgi:hypothetical protein
MSCTSVISVVGAHAGPHCRISQPNDPYLETEEFKKDCKKAANKLLAEIEWRKRQLEKRIQEEEGVCARCRAGHDKLFFTFAAMRGLWDGSTRGLPHCICRDASGEGNLSCRYRSGCAGQCMHIGSSRSDRHGPLVGFCRRCATSESDDRGR